MSDDIKDHLDLTFFKEMCLSAPFGITIYDSDLNCVYFNERSTKLFEFNPEDTLGKNLLEIVPGIEKTDRYEKYCETLETGKTNKIYFCKASSENPNESICFDVQIVKIEDKLVLIIEDVTTEKYLEQEKDIQLRSLMETIPTNIYFKDRDFKYTFVNKGAKEFLEMDIDDIIGKTDFDLFDRELAEKTRKEDALIISQGMTYNAIEDAHVSKSGNVAWFSTTKVPLKDINDKITGILGISFDITDRKTVESEVELLISTMHQTSEAIVITDKDGIIQYVNPAFEEISGYGITEAVGENPSILQSGKHDDSFYTELWDTISHGDSWRGIMINKRKDGTLYQEEATISPVRNQYGDITNFVAVKKDVTNEKQLEDQLRQSQKMEAIGRLAGGVAHDFNNILTAILGYSELLLLGMDDSDPQKSKIEEIRKAGKRASSLTKQMLAFSKKQVIERKNIDLNKTIEDMVEMLRRIIGENIKFNLELDDQLDGIMSDSSQIEQILLNLTVNSKDAMPDKGGVLTVKTENAYLKSEYVDGNFKAPPGSYIKISVSDNGCGMGEETLDHIFEPFFSSRKDSSGTGLGLSTVYGIVKQHDGFIEVQSNLGSGSTFNVFLPSALPSTIKMGEETAEGEDILNEIKGQVLLVEDESPVLNLACSILKLNGFSVSTAMSAEEAFEVFDKSETPFDLLVTDIVLPGMAGNELADALKKKSPELNVIFMSGYPGEALKDVNVNSRDLNFIAKPFTMEDFSRKVREAMGTKIIPED